MKLTPRIGCSFSCDKHPDHTRTMIIPGNKQFFRE
jgi:hypothetical protein